MGTLVSITRLVADLALGLWLGTMVFFSFVTAPRVFAVLDAASAGRIVTDIFPRYYVIGVALGIVAFVAGLATGVVAEFDFFLGVFFGGVAIAVTAAGYARWVLIPKMDRAGDDAFQQYHRQSVLLNGVALLGVAVAFVASHF